MPRKKTTTKSVATEIEPDSHDRVVLQAVDALPKIVAWAHRHGISSFDELDYWQVELEYPLDQDSGKGYVDIALLDSNEQPFLLLEIKGPREAQTASAWTRQTRGYEKATNQPCILVVAHDLGNVQKDYLAIAGVVALDIRKL